MSHLPCQHYRKVKACWALEEVSRNTASSNVKALAPKLSLTAACWVPRYVKSTFRSPASPSEPWTLCSPCCLFIPLSISFHAPSSKTRRLMSQRWLIRVADAALPAPTPSDKTSIATGGVRLRGSKQRRWCAVVRLPVRECRCEC